SGFAAGLSTSTASSYGAASVSAATGVSHVSPGVRESGDAGVQSDSTGAGESELPASAAGTTGSPWWQPRRHGDRYWAGGSRARRWWPLRPRPSFVRYHGHDAKRGEAVGRDPIRWRPDQQDVGFSRQQDIDPNPRGLPGLLRHEWAFPGG